MDHAGHDPRTGRLGHAVHRAHRGHVPLLFARRQSRRVRDGDGTRVCSGVILPDDAFDPWLTMQADTDPFWIAADGSTLVLPLPGMQSLVVAPAESEQAAQELLQSLQEALPDETKNAISPYLK